MEFLPPFYAILPPILNHCNYECNNYLYNLESQNPNDHSFYYQPTNASEILAKKRSRNACAAARFRDRRKKYEKEIQQKCQRLEIRVKELEGMDHTKVIELEKKLDEVYNERNLLNQKLQDQEKEARIDIIIIFFNANIDEFFL